MNVGIEYHYAIFDMRVGEVPSAEAATNWLKATCDHFGFGLDGISRKDFVAPVPGHAYTIVAVLSSSHAVIHTAPEESWVEVAFACCKNIDPNALYEKVKEFFKPEDVRTTSFIGSVPRSTLS